MLSESYDYCAVEAKWQDAWFDAKLHEASCEQKQKFFIHFAYPGVSGFLHVGHMRGFSYCDIIARYKKMCGYSVLFPAGFHASGIPSAGFAKKVELGDEKTLELLRQNGCSEEVINSLKTPQGVVDYFSDVYVEEYWKKFGFLIDYSRLMTTISDGYKQFIKWQFHKLHEQDLLTQKPHFAPFCPSCGPVAVDKSETDISSGGGAEVLEFTVLKFRLDDGTILPAATLRPETIFGVTNMWVNPDVVYEKVSVGGELWLCSSQCLEKLSFQLDEVESLGEKVKGSDLVGKTASVPMIDRRVPILEGPFADPDIATGIVMSVPAHAPYDWIALRDSGAEIEPIVIIDVKDFNDVPAKEVCLQLGVKSQADADLLDEATDLVYKKEFHTGFLNDRCEQYAGIRVSEIKDTVKEKLIAENLGGVFREFSEPVVCRCGERVRVKKIPDQWFIEYSNAEWTKKAISHVESMSIFPEEYKSQLPGVLEWFGDRAAIRRGSWLGTEFPFKSGWTVEPISDSTLYSAYYIVSKFVNDGSISVDEMDVCFFDYVFLGRGEPRSEVWKTIRDQFLYWYPIDINLGGKEHKTVHFPVYIMNHVAIMNKEHWPSGIFVHWWVTQKGKEKISKSKGGAEPIVQAQEIYGVDAMRLYYAHVGSPFVDIEWTPEVVLKYKQRVVNVWSQFHRLLELSGKSDPALDRWLLSVLQSRIAAVSSAFNCFDLRVAANEIFFEMQKNLSWYLKRGGCSKEVLECFMNTWTALMSPFTPHIAEELWQLLGNAGFVSVASFPVVDDSLVSRSDEVGEYLLGSVVDDISEILKVTKISPSRIIVYTSPLWKTELLQEALAMVQTSGNVNVGELMKKAMAVESLRSLGKQVSKFVGRLAGEVKKMNSSDRARYAVSLDEKKYLVDSLSYLEEVFSCSVEVFSADDKSCFDPKNKCSFASPLKPALYIE